MGGASEALVLRCSVERKRLSLVTLEDSWRRFSIDDKRLLSDGGDLMVEEMERGSLGGVVGNSVVRNRGGLIRSGDRIIL